MARPDATWMYAALFLVGTASIIWEILHVRIGLLIKMALSCLIVAFVLILIWFTYQKVSPVFIKENLPIFINDKRFEYPSFKDYPGKVYFIWDDFKNPNGVTFTIRNETGRQLDGLVFSLVFEACEPSVSQENSKWWYKDRANAGFHGISYREPGLTLNKRHAGDFGPIRLSCPDDVLNVRGTAAVSDKLVEKTLFDFALITPVREWTVVN